MVRGVDDTWSELAGRLRHTADPASRADLVKATAASAGVSVATVYRHLQRHGYHSGRARRSDAGSSRLDGEVLTTLTKLMAAGRNKRGQLNTPLKEAYFIAQEQGLLPADISYGHVARLMRQSGLGVAHLRAPEAAIARVSKHPNHVWFFDISVAIQWYFRDESGKKLDLYQDAGSRFYEGKRHNFVASKRVIHRFTVTDHYSGAYYVRYYYSAGETTVDVVDFLYRAMAPKAGDRNPMHGLPKRLVMDQGSANKSAEVRHLLADLGVQVEYHGVGNPKASGSVEQRHYRWQTQFEGRLPLSPGGNLEELNNWAEGMGAKFNQERVHSRHGRPPAHLWLTITPEQLREPPERDLFLSLASSKLRTGTLNAQLWLRADGRKWLVRGDNVYPGQKVQFRLHPFLEGGIRVYDEHGFELVAVALSFDPVSGFVDNGLRHVWDDDEAKGAKAPRTPAQHIARDSIAAPVRIDELFSGLDELEAQDLVARRRGTPFSAPAAASAPLEFDDLVAREEAVRRLGRGLSPAEAAWWRNHAQGGLTRDAFDAAFTLFCTGVAVVASS
jgi:transposase InsO family protein